MHLGGYLYKDYHDARSLEHKVQKYKFSVFAKYYKIVECGMKPTTHIVGMRRKMHKLSARIPEGKRTLVWITLHRTLQCVAFWGGMKGVKVALNKNPPNWQQALSSLKEACHVQSTELLNTHLTVFKTKRENLYPH